MVSRKIASEGQAYNHGEEGAGRCNCNDVAAFYRLMTWAFEENKHSINDDVLDSALGLIIQHLGKHYALRGDLLN
jgi:hypothetical protein